MEQPHNTPKVNKASVAPTVGQVLLGFDTPLFGNPGEYVAAYAKEFLPGANQSVTAPLHNLLYALTKTGTIPSATVSDLNLGHRSVALRLWVTSEPDGAYEVPLYEAIVRLVNYLRGHYNMELPQLQTVAQQVSRLTTLDNPERVQYNEATRQVGAGVLTALVEAINWALAHPDPACLPPELVVNPSALRAVPGTPRDTAE